MYRYVGRKQITDEYSNTSYTACILLNEDTGYLHHIRVASLKKLLHDGETLTNMILKGTSLVSLEADEKQYANFSALSKNTIQILGDKFKTRKDGTVERKIIYLKTVTSRNIIMTGALLEQDFINECYATPNLIKINFGIGKKSGISVLNISPATNMTSCRKMPLHSDLSNIFDITDAIAPDFDSIGKAAKALVTYATTAKLSLTFAKSIYSVIQPQRNTDVANYIITYDVCDKTTKKRCGTLLLLLNYYVTLSDSYSFRLSWQYHMLSAISYMNFMYNDVSSGIQPIFSVSGTQIPKSMSIHDYILGTLTSVWNKTITSAYLARTSSLCPELTLLNSLYNKLSSQMSDWNVLNICQSTMKQADSLYMQLTSSDKAVRVAAEKEAMHCLYTIKLDTVKLVFDKPLLVTDGIRLKRVDYITSIPTVSDQTFVALLKQEQRHSKFITRERLLELIKI